jgi:hypothetical protein
MSIDAVLVTIIRIVLLLAVGTRHDPSDKVAVLIVKDFDVNRSDGARGRRRGLREYERASLDDETNEILESFIVVGVFRSIGVDQVMLDLIGPKVPDESFKLLVLHIDVKTVSDSTAGADHLPKDVSLEFLC